MTKRRARTAALLFSFGLVIAGQASRAAGHDRASALAASQAATGGGQHDFDFEIGSWKARLSRLDRPLTGSTTWLEYEGASVVRKVGDGPTNLGELAVRGAAGQLEGHLYPVRPQPQMHTPPTGTETDAICQLDSSL